MNVIGVGHADKMRVEWGEPIQYFFRLDEEEIPVNPLITQRIRIRHTGSIRCGHCGRPTKKSFNQGYCFPCFKKLAQCDSCIMSPEKCHYAAGTCREPEWGETHCMVDHIVYLANSSGIKVGITRKSQVPIRWIDQGATQAIPMYQVATRHLSGLVEVLFKSQVTDRTNWRAMLKGNPEPMDMAQVRADLHAKLQVDVQAIDPDPAAVKFLGQSEIVTDLPGSGGAVTLDYPVWHWPNKVTSINLDKTPEVEGQLLGIKGQYLILDAGCINIRKYSAYELEIALETS